MRKPLATRPPKDRHTPAWSDAMDLFWSAKRDLEDAPFDTKIGRDLPSTLNVIARLEEFARGLRVVLSDLHADAAKQLDGQKKIDLGGDIGVVESFTTSSTKWDDVALFGELSKHVPIAVQPESGEVTIDGARFSALLQSLASVAYWRKTKLRELGIDPDEYSTVSWGGKKIRIKSQEGRHAVHSAGSSGGSRAVQQQAGPDVGGTQLPANDAGPEVPVEPIGELRDTPAGS